MAGMSPREAEAFAAGCESLRAVYPMLGPTDVSETVRAVLAGADPVIRTDAVSTERERISGHVDELKAAAIHFANTIGDSRLTGGFHAQAEALSAVLHLIGEGQ
jgi:hypothetical protein